MKKEHEKQVCNTLIRFIAERKGIVISDISYPDEKEHNSQSVDVLIKSPSLEIVMEHTQIESYPEQIEDNRRILKLLKPLEDMLKGKLPSPGEYQLCINIGAVKGARDTKSIQKELIKWVKEKAPSLQLGSPDSAPAHYIREKPAGVPFEVILYRWPGGDGGFRIILSTPEGLEKKRRERISEALEGKCPKLCKARGDNRTSVLVLELNDIYLGNYSSVGLALVDELSYRNDAPDEVYLVRTELEQWRIWVLKEGTKFFRDVENQGPHYLGPT